jgi:hypothetical protein
MATSIARSLLKTLRDIREDFKGGQTTNVAYEDWDELSEDAEYEGKKVSLNKPFRTPGAERKFAVYVKNDKGNVVMVRFGDPNMEIKRDDPDRRSNYRARHGCDDPGPKWKANYWSCRMWAKKSVSSIVGESTRAHYKAHYKPNQVPSNLKRAYDSGYTHGQTGYGFQKHDAGRKGTAQYDAYVRGYADGGDDSGHWVY